MEIILFHPDVDVIGAIDAATAQCTGVTTLYADYAELYRSGLARDGAVVSPGNSFGILDGGFDAALYEAHGPLLELYIKRAIIDEYGLEMPVGTALYIAAPDGQPIIYAPTMQGPMGISGTDNVYLAARAAAHCARRHNLRRLYMPLLGTGAGGVDLEIALEQLLTGARDGSAAITPEQMTWEHADRMHQRWHRMWGVPDDGYRWADAHEEASHSDGQLDDPAQC